MLVILNRKYIIMFVEAIKKVTPALFPIFVQHRQGNQTRIKVAGTGFFIDSEGVFLTASHLIEEVEALEGEVKLLYCGRLPKEKWERPIEIEELYRDSHKDLFLGKVSPVNLGDLPTLSGKHSPVGHSLCMCGYPMAQLSMMKPNVLNADNVRIYFQPTFVLDGFKGEHKQGEVTKEWQGFITRDTSYPGMSGGPVFDANGVIWGMDVGTFHRKIAQGSNTILVNNGISVGADVLDQFVRAHAESKEKVRQK